MEKYKYYKKSMHQELLIQYVIYNIFFCDNEVGKEKDVINIKL